MPINEQLAVAEILALRSGMETPRVRLHEWEPVGRQPSFPVSRHRRPSANAPGWHDPARVAAAEAKRRRKALALNKAREAQP